MVLQGLGGLSPLFYNGVKYLLSRGGCQFGRIIGILMILEIRDCCLDLLANLLNLLLSPVHV